MSDTMGKIIKAGNVEVKKPFIVKQFDEDDGWQEIKITPNTYEYRVLNVNGWKPRQLKVLDDWVDVMGDCEELEELLNSVDETTTVANIAPTVDYMGHVKPIQYLSGNETSYESEYDNPDDKKKEDDEEEKDVWVSPIGRIIAGESVRKVLLSPLPEQSKKNSVMPEAREIDVYDDPRFKEYMKKSGESDPEWEAFQKEQDKYEALSEKFIDASHSPEKFFSYLGHLEVLEDSLRKDYSDDKYDYWYFDVHDADLDSFAEELKHSGSKLDYDWIPSYYFINCIIPVEKDSSVQKIKNMVSAYFKSGKRSTELVKEIEALPYVGEIDFDWDTK